MALRKTQRRTAPNDTPAGHTLASFVRFANVHPLTVSVAIVLVLITFQQVFFVSSYQTNDDIGMTFVVSGTGTTPSPDEHLRFSNVIVGFVLKFLYTKAPDVPWYGLYHMAVHFLALTALLFALVSRGFTWRRVLFFLLYFAAVGLYFLNELQFTVTAFVAGQAGAFLFVSAAGTGQPALRSPLMIACAVILIALSAMIRTSSCYLALLLALPLMLITVFGERYSRQAILNFVVFIVLTAVLVGGVTAFDRGWYNRDPEWRDFSAVNALKSRFIDWHHTEFSEETKHAFDEVGWSINDYYMLLTWFYADETVYSRENLEKILAHFPSYKSYLTPGQVASRLREIFADGAYIIALVLLFALCLPPGRKPAAALAGTAVTAVALMIFLIYTKRLPGRVYFPMFSFLAACGMFLAGDGTGGGGYMRRLLTGIAGAAAVLWILAVVSNQHSLGAIKLHARSSFRKTIEDIEPRGERLFVVWGNALPYTHILPFDSLDFIRQLKLMSLGTTLRTPITRERMREFGIDDIYRALYEKPEVLLVVQDLKYLYYYSQYVLEHYGVNVQYRYIYQTTVFSVVQVIGESSPEYLENVVDRKVINPY